MPASIIEERKVFPTQWTFVRRSRRAVHSHVEHQVCFLRETLLASVTFETFLTRVDPHVVF